jgi:PhzF family phenazine biosynthesis protein
MRTPLYQLDAFATALFAGNPAAVMPMADFPPDAVMQALAAENNLAETAFLVPDGGDYRLRWFTPAVEVPLCGHATLASAAVVMQRLEPARRHVVFHSRSGPLTVTRTELGYRMDLPARSSQVIPAPSGFAKMLGAAPVEVALNAFNYLVRLDSPAAVRALEPDLRAIAALDRHGLIVTAAGGLEGQGAHDFTSRYFAPAKGIDEDPVTGAAHCMLAPYWAERLGKSDFRAFQASKRGGEILCAVKGERVELEGAVVFYLEGEVTL